MLKKQIKLIKLIVIFLLIISTNTFLMSEIPSIESQKREKLFLTIYNMNLGLIREIREVKIPKGEIILKCKNIPSKIDPTTVQLKSLTSQDSLKIIEQKYEYDLLTPEKLFEKYKGKEIILVSIDPKTKEEKREKAILLTTSKGKIYKIGDRIVVSFPGRVEFPKLPKDLIIEPTLSWILKNEYNKPQKIEISYLTEGINWKAYYVAHLKDSFLDLTGWVNIENKTGINFNRAIPKLIAGEIQRIKPERVSEMRILAAKAPSSQIQEKEFFEYYIYNLKKPIDIKNNEIKQFVLFQAYKIPVIKKYILKGKQYYFRTRYNVLEKEERVDIYLDFKNKKENNLGIALPKGIVRVYSQDQEGNFQFIGEDSIAHTPQGEEISLKVGKAFDIIATRKQTSYKRISDKIYESSFEIKIKNHKNQNIKVSVIEPVYGEWEILNYNYPYQKIDAYNFKFEIPVKKNSQSSLRYTIRIKY